MAVNVSNIEILWYDATPASLVELARGTTSDSVARGDLMDDDTGAGEVDVVGDADKDEFVGVSLSTIDGDTDTNSKVIIAMKAVLRLPLATGQTTIYLGEAAAWAAGANGTTWTFANTVTEAIAHCLSETIAAGSTGKFIIDPYTVRAVTALGHFEVQA